MSALNYDAERSQGSVPVRSGQSDASLVTDSVASDLRDLVDTYQDRVDLTIADAMAIAQGLKAVADALDAVFDDGDDLNRVVSVGDSTVDPVIDAVHRHENSCSVEDGAPTPSLRTTVQASVALGVADTRAGVVSTPVPAPARDDEVAS